MTIWGAHANFEDQQKGSIEIGKVADFIILDRDIVTIPENRILNTSFLFQIPIENSDKYIFLMIR